MFLVLVAVFHEITPQCWVSSIGGKYHHFPAERTSYFSFEGLLNVLSLFQKLRQHFPNIPPNAQGTGLDRLRAEGLVLIDADVQRSRILNGELPERHFDDAGVLYPTPNSRKRIFCPERVRRKVSYRSAARCQPSSSAK